MENDIDATFKELSPSEVRDLQLGIRHFFTNYPHQGLKVKIWDLYRGWVFNSAEYVGCEEITNMLLFYEALLAFIDDAHQYRRYLDRTVLRRHK